MARKGADKSDKSKSSKNGKGKVYHHDPDDLRDEYELSTQRYVIANMTLIWDSALNTTLEEPPLPDCEDKEKSSKSKGKGKGKDENSKKTEVSSGSWHLN